jgi:hypothetical protein
MTKFKSARTILLLLVVLLINSQGNLRSSGIELKDGYIFIDGQKVFLKGIGYEYGANPGCLPWACPYDQEVLESDMQRIVDAGFNTIRTWDAFTDQELQIIRNFDIKIIMGIWIDPHGDFGSESFVNNALEYVTQIMNYSKNYDNIIAYLIMNEPLPEDIFGAGYGNTVSLWNKVIDLIHKSHTGVPVSIANTCVGTYIEPAIFDFSAYNMYPYNPATINFSHKYPAYVNYIKNLRDDGMPLIITEYGLSVSPGGPGGWGYGGNTLEEQTAGIMYMYRSLIDGGASGSCVFNYSDGWWKAGSEFVHDDAAEEWFGLVEYETPEDKFGTPRPVWDTLKIYNRAVITSPVNQGIYGSGIPVEIFTSDTVAGVAVFDGEEILLEENITDNYFCDTIFIDVASIRDVLLKFDFYDSQKHLLKRESLKVLGSLNEVELPEITINVSPEPEKGDNNVYAEYSVSNNGPLEIDYELDYVFYTHMGWEYGYAGTTVLNSEIPVLSQTFDLPSGADVVTVAAGLDAVYGNFVKRLTNQKIFILGDTTVIHEPDYINIPVMATRMQLVYPNPANDYITVSNNNHELIEYCITDISGQIIENKKFYMTNTIDIRSLQAGFYIIAFRNNTGRFIYSVFIKK